MVIRALSFGKWAVCAKHAGIIHYYVRVNLAYATALIDKFTTGNTDGVALFSTLLD